MLVEPYWLIMYEASILNFLHRICFSTCGGLLCRSHVKHIRCDKSKMVALYIMNQWGSASIVIALAGLEKNRLFLVLCYTTYSVLPCH